MSTNYPTSKDTFTDKSVNDWALPEHINNVQDAIEALETKVGITNSTDTNSIDKKVSTLITDVDTAESNIITLTSNLTTVSGVAATASSNVTTALEGYTRNRNDINGLIDGSKVRTGTIHTTASSMIEQDTLQACWVAKYKDGLGVNNTGIYIDIVNKELEIVYSGNPCYTISLDTGDISNNTTFAVLGGSPTFKTGSNTRNPIITLGGLDKTCYIRYDIVDDELDIQQPINAPKVVLGTSYITYDGNNIVAHPETDFIIEGGFRAENAIQIGNTVSGTNYYAQFKGYNNIRNITYNDTLDRFETDTTLYAPIIVTPTVNATTVSGTTFINSGEHQGSRHSYILNRTTMIGSGYMGFAGTASTGGMTSTAGIRAIRAGSITGLSISTNPTVQTSQGDITLQARVNDTPVFTITVASNGINTEVHNVGTQARNSDTFVAGDLLTLYINFDSFVGTLSPTYSVLEVMYDT